MSRAYTVLVPVGPDEDEIHRLWDLTDSLRAHLEGHDPKVVLVDDAPEPRPLDAAWPGAEVVRTSLWNGRLPDVHSAMVAGTIEGMRRAEGQFALKLDTDALVIRSFYDRVRDLLCADPSVGVLGACRTSPDGRPRDLAPWMRAVERCRRPVRVSRGRSGRPEVYWLTRTVRREVGDVLAAAMSNPDYRVGAHCLGGAYVVSTRLIAAARSWDWRLWVRSGLSEDVVVGILCAAAGLRMVDSVCRNGIFGVSWLGLPASPDQLLSSGYCFVHSVKSSAYGDESAIRAWFRQYAR